MSTEVGGAVPNRPISVLHLTAGSEAGGISRYLSNLCRAMHAEGHRVVIAGRRGAWQSLFDDAPWPWIDVPLHRGPLALRRSASRLTEYLSRHPVDVVHAHYRRSALVGRRVARRGGLPLLFTLHLTGVPMRGPARWFSDFGDHAHAPSQMARQWLIDEAGVDPKRVTVIPHGVDPQDFPVADGDRRRAARADLGLPADCVVAAFVGRFDEPKNEGWMLDLAAASRQTLPSLRVALMGEGPREPLIRHRIRSDGLADRVMLLPFADPRPLYEACDAVFLPSSQEGFSLVTSEAMCMGRPVLRTRTAGTQEHIVEDVTGRSVPIDRDAFIKAALGLLYDPGALHRMGLAAASHVREHLTFEQQRDRMLALYRRLIRGSAVVHDSSP